MLSLCLHLFSLNLCHLISAVDVILFGLDWLSIMLYSYVHIPHINCLIISLNWYFVNLGFKCLRVFYTHFELLVSSSTTIVRANLANLENSASY